MKVLRTIAGLDPGFGGPSVSSVNSAIATARQDVEVHFAFPDPNPAEADGFASVAALRDAGIAVTILPLASPGRRLAKPFGFSPALARFVRTHGASFDLLHAHSPWVYPTWYVVRRHARAATPVVLTPHEGLTRFDMSHARLWPLLGLKRALKSYYLRNVDAVIFSSGLEQRDSVDGTAGNWCVVPHPVYDDRTRQPHAHCPAADAAAPLHVGFLGRLHPKKNLELMIAALAATAPIVRLVVAGDGPADYAAGLRALATEHGVADRIDWLGFVQGPAKDDFLAGIDLLAMPSDYECFGMAAAEAMVAGIPVLVSRETGVAEIVEPGGGGLIVERDPDAIARAVMALATDRGQLAALASAAAAAATAFSFTSHGRHVVGLYGELVDGGRA